MVHQKQKISGWWLGVPVVVGILATLWSNSDEEETSHNLSDLTVPEVSQSILQDFNNIVKDPNPTRSSQEQPLRDQYRESVMLSEVRYNPIGRLLIDGNNSCSAAIGELDGYVVTRRGVTVVSTAHCVLDAQGQIERDISFVTNFVNAVGREQEVRLSNPVVWHDDRYQQNGVDGTEEHDKAILFFPRVTLPSEIQPIPVFVAENSDARSIREFFDMSVMAVDYSQNLRGLSAHVGCDILDTSASYLRADCAVTNQGSGGALLSSGEETDFRLIGVASEYAVQAHEDGSRSAYAYFTQDDFARDMPSFLRALAR